MLPRESGSSFRSFVLVYSPYLSPTGCTPSRDETREIVAGMAVQRSHCVSGGGRSRTNDPIEYVDASEQHK